MYRTRSTPPLLTLAACGDVVDHSPGPTAPRLDVQVAVDRVQLSYRATSDLVASAVLVYDVVAWVGGEHERHPRQHRRGNSYHLHWHDAVSLRRLRRREHASHPRV